MIWILIATAVFLFLLYKFTRKPDDYFEKRGVKYVKPPGLRMLVDIFLKKDSLADAVKKMYTELAEEKISGMFEFGKPTFVVRDPKLVKKLAVKEFDHYTDHKPIFSDDIEPILGKSLFFLKGKKWRDMRATLSPAFTGSRMRQMFEFVSLVGKQVAKTLSEQSKARGNDSFEFKELAKKFTVDVIATAAFGIEVNSFANPGNDFHRIATKATNFSSIRAVLTIMGSMIMPSIMKLLGFKLFDNETVKFFSAAIIDTMKIRDERGIVRNDMINLLMQSTKGKLKHSDETETEKHLDGFATVEESQVGRTEVTIQWTDEDLIAQCFVFFLAGFDTVSTAMTFMAHELLENPDVQRKLQEEIDGVNEKLQGKPLTYEALQGMKYLDQVVSETLRKWPAVLLVDRMCIKDYNLDDDDKHFTFEEGKSFFIPIYGIHRDEKFFPNADKFDPERFSEENRGNIDPDTYMPFGIGPRACIGSRFALMEVKTMFFYLLSAFDFEPNEKTQIPVKVMKNLMNLEAESVHLRLKSRN